MDVYEIRTFITGECSGNIKTLEEKNHYGKKNQVNLPVSKEYFVWTLKYELPLSEIFL